MKLLRRLFRRFVAIWLTVCLFAGPARAQNTAEIERAAADVIRELDLQTELPLTPQQQKAWRLPDLLPDWFSDFNIGHWMLWGGLVLFLCIVLYAFRDELPILRFVRNRRWDADRDGEGAGAAAHGQKAVTADELAMQGHYVEAMHLLLLRAIAETRHKLGAHFADSLTSREILRKAPLTDTGRTFLHDIIRRVEWSYFGEYPAVQEDYAACRESFDRFLSTLPESARI